MLFVYYNSYTTIMDSEATHIYLEYKGIIQAAGIMPVDPDMGTDIIWPI